MGVVSICSSGDPHIIYLPLSCFLTCHKFLKDSKEKNVENNYLNITERKMLYKKCNFLPLPSKFLTQSENFFFFLCVSKCMALIRLEENHFPLKVCPQSKIFEIIA